MVSGQRHGTGIVGPADFTVRVSLGWGRRNPGAALPHALRQDALFEDCDDANPLLSRCARINLSRQSLAKPFAERVKQGAAAQGLDGQPIERYVKLAYDCKLNMREMWQRVEGREMLE